jgi:hypothetical protein
MQYGAMKVNEKSALRNNGGVVYEIYMKEMKNAKIYLGHRIS